MWDLQDTVGTLRQESTRARGATSRGWSSRAMVDGAFVGPEVIPEPISLSAAPEHRLEIQARGTGAVVKAVEVVLVGVYPQYALELHEILANTRDPLEPDLER